MYIKSGAMLGGQKVDCCEGSFERCYLLTQAIALAKRRSLTQKTNSPLEELFLSRECWARLLFWYESRYRSGLLAYFSCLVPTSWSQKAGTNRRTEAVFWRTFPARCPPAGAKKPHPGDRGSLVTGRRPIRKTATKAHIAGLRWNQWGISRSPPYCKPIPQNQ